MFPRFNDDEILSVLCTNSLNFEIYFLSFPWETVLDAIQGNYFMMYLALRKSKIDCKKNKIILVPDFCPLKPEIARFYIGFVLNTMRERIEKQ